MNTTTKSILLCVIVLLLFVQGYSQSRREVASREMGRGNYYAAREALLQINKKTEADNYEISHASYHLRDYATAWNYVNKNSHNQAEILLYTKLLCIRGDYTKANKVAAQLTDTIAGEPTRPLRLSLEWAQQPSNNETHGEIVEQIDIRNTFKCLGIGIYNNKIVVSAATNNSGKDAQGTPYTDMYEVDIQKTDSSQLKLLGTNMVLDQHEGHATFTVDEDTMYFYHDKNGVMKIYEAVWVGNMWDLSQKLLFPQNCMHPALSPDNRFLVFASDCAGGYGGWDLYISYRDGRGWSEPQNLGDEINNSGDQVFPFVDADGSLYFASDLDLGFGGFDIYRSAKHDSLWGTPHNIKKPYNSSRDDFAFVRNRQRPSEVFIASNRDGSGEKDYVYRISEAKAIGDELPKNIGMPCSKAGVIFRINVSKSKISEEPPAGFPATDLFPYFYQGQYQYALGNYEQYEQALIAKRQLEQQYDREFEVIPFKNDYPDIEGVYEYESEHRKGEKTKRRKN